MNITRTVHNQFTAQKAVATTSTTNVSSSRPVRIESKRSSILMEANLSLKSSFRASGRLSVNTNDERLMKILAMQPDEPLFLDETQWKSKYKLNKNPMMTTATTTSTTSAIQTTVDDSENCPPQLKATMSMTTSATTVATTSTLNATSSANDRNAVTSSEEVDSVEMSPTSPTKQANHHFLNHIKRDLNSPSANARIRALRALKNPTGGNYYNFDVPHEEQEIVSEAERNQKPKTIQDVMEDVVVYVEVRTANDNRTAGVKKVISELGAKVNDRLLRNTTHVIFKDGLQSTYNKAKSWNIPVVSILWIEACRKHLCLMDPTNYPISNLDQYENPLLYDKIKRHKSMQPGTEERILNRKVPKSKLLECTRDEFSSPIPSSNQTVSNSTPKSTTKSTPTTKKSVIATKSIEKPKNTIRSMFERQLVKNRHANERELDANENIDEIDKTEPEDIETDVQATTNDIKKSETVTDVILTPGKLHSRLTRRNSLSAITGDSITIDTSAIKIPITPRTNKSHRRTIFTPSMSQTIIPEEEHTNQTIGLPQPMEITLKQMPEKCNIESNNMQLKTPAKTVDCLPDGVDVRRSRSAKKPTTATKTILKRRTLYTPQAMELTKIDNDKKKRRQTISRSSASNTNNDMADIHDTQSCDAFEGKMPTLDLGADLATKTLLEQYSNTFHSKRTMVSSSRRTISHISMDIIRQRVDNINRICSMERSMNESLNAHDGEIEDENVDNVDDASSPNTDDIMNTPNADKPKPAKRKLFAPPSLFQSPSIFETKPDAKSTPKRVRDNSSPPELKIPKTNDKKLKKTGGDTTDVKKATITAKSRRSTLLFESAEKPKKKTTIVPCATVTSRPVMVFTNMHQKQVEVIREVVKKLGKFEIEDAVSVRTTHVVTLEPRRTVNLLKGMIRGLWIVTYDWIEKSAVANEWLLEDAFELNSFSKMIQICRMERRIFGQHYRMDIFSGVGVIFVSSKSKCKHLAELIRMCHGKVTQNQSEASYIIDVAQKECGASGKCVSYNWILDSIMNGKIILNLRSYAL